MKKILLLIVFAALMLSGCFNKAGTKSYNAAFINVNENMKKQFNYQIKTTVKYGDGQYVQTDNIAKISLKNGISERIIDITTSGEKSYAKSYTVYKAYTYITYSYGDDTNKWSKVNVSYEKSDIDVLSVFDAFDVKNLEFKKSPDNPKIYTVRVKSIDYITAVLEDNIKSEFESRITKYTGDLKDIRYEVCIDPAENLLKYIHIDMSAVVTDSDKGVTEITVEFSNYKNTKVTVPEEEIEYIISDPYTKQARYDFSAVTDKIKYERTVIPVDFTVNDAVLHPLETVFYMISSSDKKLYEVNYLTNSMRKIEFTQTPKCLTYHDGRLYVALSDAEYNSSHPENDRKGMIVIVNAASMETEKTFSTETDAYDIEVDKDGNIFISPDSFNWGNLNIYSSEGALTSSVMMFGQSMIRYNSATDRLYCINKLLAPRSFEIFSISNGVISEIPVPEHARKVELNAPLYISSDGRYIFNGSGIILKSSTDSSLDLKTEGQVRYAFENIAFDLKRSTVYTSHGRQILKQDFNTHDPTGYYLTYGYVQYLFFNNDSLVSVSKDINDRYFIEILGEQREPVQEHNEKIYLQDNIPILNFIITDSVKHPSKNIYYFISYADRALYSYNNDTTAVKEVKLPLPPERITFANGKIYVTLLKGTHSMFWFMDDQEGAFAVLNADTLELELLADINIDPFDITADSEGNIYVTPGSGQTARIKKYDPSGKFIKEGIMYECHYIFYNSVLKKLYTIETNSSTVHINAYSTDLSDMKRCPVHNNEFTFEENMYISPDGKYIFNGSGDILSVSGINENDLISAGKLKHKYDTLAFDEKNNRIYTAKDKTLYIYDYTTFELVEKKTTDRPVLKLYCNNGEVYALIINRQSLNQLILL